MPDEVEDTTEAWGQTASGWRLVESDYEQRVLAREQCRRAGLALYQRVMAELIEYARRMPWR